MVSAELITIIKNKLPGFKALAVTAEFPTEIIMQVNPGDFKGVCLSLHDNLRSPVMTFFAVDEREKHQYFMLYCYFIDPAHGQWIAISLAVSQDDPVFDSLASSIYSASFFEREIWEMFGIEPKGHPDLRRLHLHEEVWPAGNFPLRKDFRSIQAGELGEYKFTRVEGEGIFEVPVGPVHAGIIGPGHFRFSVAGEPIINLEPRLGFTHRGVEKLFEGKPIAAGLRLAECISGDSAFAHSLAFSQAVEKIAKVEIPWVIIYQRGILLELERMYNHVNDLGGIAVDVGFGFPAALAAIIKENILQINEKLTGSRYLKGVNSVGKVLIDIDQEKKQELKLSLTGVKADFTNLQKILYESISFMDRVDGTCSLKRKIAEDLGVIGLAGRASGRSLDLRKHDPGIYREAKFRMVTEQSGDVWARVKVRVQEFAESLRLIEVFLDKMSNGEKSSAKSPFIAGSALGGVEGWRGPVLYWLKVDAAGIIERCKITDPSFHNWPGIPYAVLGNIIPDFPVCNKSFDLSYSGNDL